LDNKIANKKPDFEYVDRESFTEKKTGEHGNTKTIYKWESKKFMLTKEYVNVWKYGEAPSDGRYSQPKNRP